MITGVKYKLGTINNDGYIVLNKNVFNIEHNIYLHKSIILSKRGQKGVFYFSQPYYINSNPYERYVSVFKKIDELISDDFYIGGENENAISMENFFLLLDEFPNTEEIKRYINTRMSHIISEYVPVKRNYNQFLDELVEKKRNRRHLPKDDIKSVRNGIEENYKSALDSLKLWLEDSSSYTESQWQDMILDIILLLFPKYISARKSQKILTTIPGKYKQVDIILFDSLGFIDILEVKKPLVGNNNVLKSGVYRDNYIPSKELSGAVMQVEKYIFWLSQNSTGNTKKIQQDNKIQLPNDYLVKIANPQAMIIFGRDNQYSEDQKNDLEIIKRKYKSVIDIMTYDDLVRRIENLLNMLYSK